jgi:RHS repeat-associated protein
MKTNNHGSFNKFNHHPFGMITFGRSWEAGSGYRYAFNGMEAVDEIVGNDNALDFGARVYDARLGRWFSIDPKFVNYQSVSPYIFSLGNPILYKDFGGNDAIITIQSDPSGCGGKITIAASVYVTGGTETMVKGFNDEFIKWSDEGLNKGTFIDENGDEWQIEISMTFVVATDKDVKRILSNGQGESGDNLFSVTEIDRPEAKYLDTDNRNFNYLPLDGKYYDYSTEYQLGMRYAEINNTTNGLTSIHEVLHLMGLKDRYTDGYYTISDSATGEKIGYSGTASRHHEGYEDNIMGNSHNGGKRLDQQQFNNLGSAIFKAQKVAAYKSENGAIPSKFIFSRATRSVEIDKSAVPATYSKDGITYTDFVRQDF